MKIQDKIHIGGRRKISPEDVVLFSADENYTQVYLNNGRTITVATTLKTLEKRFADCEDFFRTHKSFIINTKYIKNYHPDKNSVFVQMKNDFRVMVSRRKREEFHRKFDAVLLTYSLLNY